VIPCISNCLSLLPPLKRPPEMRSRPARECRRSARTSWYSQQSLSPSSRKSSHHHNAWTCTPRFFTGSEPASTCWPENSMRLAQCRHISSSYRPKQPTPTKRLSPAYRRPWTSPERRGFGFGFGRCSSGSPGYPSHRNERNWLSMRRFSSTLYRRRPRFSLTQIPWRSGVRKGNQTRGEGKGAGAAGPIGRPLPLMLTEHVHRLHLDRPKDQQPTTHAVPATAPAAAQLTPGRRPRGPRHRSTEPGRTAKIARAGRFRTDLWTRIGPVAAKRSESSRFAVLPFVGRTLAEWTIVGGDHGQLVIKTIAQPAESRLRLRPLRFPGMPQRFEPIGHLRMFGVPVAPAHPLRTA
jgi:hypothetical protein